MRPDLSEENYALTEVLTETIKGLDALSDALPKGTMASLKQQIRSAVRQKLPIRWPVLPPSPDDW